MLADAQLTGPAGLLGQAIAVVLTITYGLSGRSLDPRAAAVEQVRLRGGFLLLTLRARAMLLAIPRELLTDAEVLTITAWAHQRVAPSMPPVPSSGLVYETLLTRRSSAASAGRWSPPCCPSS